MSRPLPTVEPSVLRAGDTWQWRRDDLPDYPAPDWTLTYAFRSAAAGFDITATADGPAHQVAVPAETTAEYAAGGYDWTAFATLDTDRFQVGTGRVEVLADVAALVTHDGRTLARRMLDAVEATLDSRATAGQLDLVRIAAGDRQLERSDLLKLRSQLQLEVRREEGRGGRPTRILARFGAQ